ncbi:MAG TPA: site-specific integrase, partial [Propionibacteriaceae bacterium]|nr:site-specific integrase [Propionibacteriaceae bacterium]
QSSFTVGEAVEDWLSYGLPRRAPKTVTKLRGLCRLHLMPKLGSKKLRDLTARDVERWLGGLSDDLSTNTLSQLLSCLSRSVRRAMSRDLVGRNVAELVDIPRGREGRRSKSLTAEQVDAVLGHTRGDRMHAYVVMSLFTGARTEELRALTWAHVHLDNREEAEAGPYLDLWRSVRAGGDTKTRRSRRTLGLPELCVRVLGEHQALQARERAVAGDRWIDTGLVFTTRLGTGLDAANVRRDFRRALRGVPGVNPGEWTPRELRHSFVSLLSNAGVPLEEIARLVGHAGTSVTEAVYRHELRPVLQTGASVMDRLFDASKFGAGATPAVTPLEPARPAEAQNP